MADEKPPMPKQPTTVALPAVPDWAIELTRSVKDGFARVDARFDAVEANQELQGGQVLDLGKRMTTLEERVGKAEGRLDNGSIRAKAGSEVDLKHDAAIALLHTKVDKLTSIAERLELIAGNPMVRKVAYAIGGAILAYLASKGWLLK